MNKNDEKIKNKGIDEGIGVNISIEEIYYQLRREFFQIHADVINERPPESIENKLDMLQSKVDAWVESGVISAYQKQVFNDFFALDSIKYNIKN